MRKAILIVLIVLILGCVALQLVPVPRDNPPVTREMRWDSPQTRALAQRACLDCHSNETVWPWYAYIAPFSWLVARDVQEGRARLNFSEWDRQRGEVAHEPEEIVEVIYEGEMPPPSYLITHPAARLTDAEKQALAEGLQATVAHDPPSGTGTRFEEEEEDEGHEDD